MGRKGLKVFVSGPLAGCRIWIGHQWAVRRGASSAKACYYEHRQADRAIAIAHRPQSSRRRTLLASSSGPTVALGQRSLAYAHLGIPVVAAVRGAKGCLGICVCAGQLVLAEGQGTSQCTQNGGLQIGVDYDFLGGAGK